MKSAGLSATVLLLWN